MTIKATYVSVWDGGYKVRTPCNYDPERKVVTSIEVVSDVEGLGVFEGEFIEFADGTVIQRDKFDIE